MNRSKATRIALAATAVMGIGLLAGCSSGSTSASTASSEASAMASTSMDGADPSSWSPVEISPDQNGQTISLILGQRATFLDLPVDDANNRIVIESSNPKAVEPTQQGTDNGVSTAAGLTAVGLGGSRILVFDGNPNDNGGEVINEYIVQVFSPDADNAPGNESPSIVTAGDSTVTLEPGSAVVVDGLPTGNYTVASDNEMVAIPMPGASTSNDPAALAVGEGTAKVTVTDGQGAVVATITVTGQVIP